VKKRVAIIAAAFLGLVLGLATWAQVRWPSNKPDATLKGRDGAATFDVQIYAPKDQASSAPIVVFVPGWGGKGAAHADLHRAIADCGFVVVALDDVDFDVLPIGVESWPRDEDFSLHDAAGVEKTKAIGEARVSLQVRHILAVISQVATHTSWRDRVNPQRIAIVGHSIGGAAGAEACLTDSRVKAVVNLDGWLFGRATKESLRCAYLWMLSKESLPRDNADDDHIEAWRQADLSAHARFAGAPNVKWVLAKRTAHTDLARLPTGLSRLIAPSKTMQDRAAQIETVVSFLEHWRDQATYDVPLAGDVEIVNEKALSGVSRQSAP
jgi:dienelactone hydrolase